jgi:hypothetical protein
MNYQPQTAPTIAVVVGLGLALAFLVATDVGIGAIGM